MDYEILKRGEFSNSRYGVLEVLKQGLAPTPPDPNFYPSAPRVASQRAGLGARSATMTPSDAGGIISYTGIPNTGTWVNNYGAICNRYISANGEFSAVRSNTGSIMISLRPNGTPTGDYASATHVTFATPAGVYYKATSGSVTQISGATFAVGDRLVLKRENSVVTINKRIADTGSDVLLYTFPDASTGNIYGHYNTDTIGVIFNPQIRGAVWDVDYSTSAIITDGNSITSGNNQVTPWPARLKQRVPFNVAGCALTSVAVSGQNTASMDTDAVTQVDVLFDVNDPSVVIALELGNQIVSTGSTARAAADLMKTYCRRRMMAGFRVVMCTAFDRQQALGGGVGTSAVAVIQAANALLLAEWNECATDVIDTRLVPELRDSSNAAYFDAAKVHPNDLALTGFIDLVAGVLINASPNTPGAVS